MTECPSCERDDFKNEEGMRWHHSYEHGEKLPSQVTCDNCGIEFRKPPSLIERSENDFCSKPCSNEYRRGKPAPPDHNFRDGGKSEYDCANCNDTINRYPSTVEANETGKAFCSRKCADQYRTGNRKSGIHYGPNWGEQRQKRLEKDHWKCVVCGKSNDQEKEDKGHALHVHHITPARNFEVGDGQIDYERANRIDNLVTLCVSCHHRWEGIPLRPQS